MSYVYIKSEHAGHLGAEHDLFTVGHYDPSGQWHPDSDHADEGEAAKRVRWLNGGRESAQSESAPISDEDKRWRFLEHGCQFVSWTPTSGETVSFDPRDVKHLSAMREKADKTLNEQVEQLRTEAAELNRRFKR